MSRTGRALSLAVAALAVLHLLPLEPIVPRPGLDGSFPVALARAQLEGLRMGPDLVYTYGPLGYLQLRCYEPGTYGQSLAAWAVYASVFLASAAASAPRRGPCAVRALWSLALVALGPSPYAFVLLVVAARADRAPPALLGCAQAFVLAGLSLAKFNQLALAGVVLLVFAARDLADRRAPRDLFAYAASLLGLWLACGQRLSDLPSYVAGSLELLRGHSAAMAMGPMDPTLGHLERVLLFVATPSVVLLHLRLARAAGWRRRGPWALSVALVAFMAFKAGLVRHDGHLLHLVDALLVALLLCGADAWRRRGGTRTLGLGVAVGCALTAWLVGWHYDAGGLPARLAEPLLAAPRRARLALDLLRGVESARLRAAYEAVLAERRADVRLPPLSGSLGLVGNDLLVVLCQPNPWRPLPAPQSFLAYTPALARGNAAALRAPDAPDALVVELEPIDGRLPAAEGGLAWPELLTRYAPREVVEGRAVVERRAAPEDYSLAPIAELALVPGEWTALPPSDAPVWAELELAPTGWGRLLDLAFRPPRVLLELRLAGGGERSFRLVPAVAGVGFVLSPLVESAAELVALGARDWSTLLADHRVEAVRVLIAGPRACYAEPYPLRLARLELPREDLSALALAEARYPRFRAPPLRVAGLTRVTRAGPGPGAARVLLNHPPGLLELAPPPGATVTLGFGVLEGAWTRGGDGVELRALWHGADGVDRPLWSRSLRPQTAPTDRGEQRAVLTLPPEPGRLVLEANPGPAGDTSWDWAYWSRVDW